MNSTFLELLNDNLIQLFEKAVNKYPDNVACIFLDDQITYNELNNRANQLANYILKQDISSNSPIAIYYERSIDLITAFLAVMKLGRPYIPIDKNASSTQIMNIIQDADVSLMLTMDELAKSITTLASETNTQLLIINQKNSRIHTEDPNNLVSFPPTELAYILYTSGTTGKPKGVQISHKSIVNLLFAMSQEIPITEKDVLIGITPFTFDLSVPDIYWPLVTGGSIILCSPMARFNPQEIINCIEQYNVTLMQATPTTWQMLVTYGWQNKSNIKIIAGGEALTNQLASQLVLLSKHVWNFYGPTETTVWSTSHKITTIDKSNPYIPIGRPLANTHVYVLDADLKPVPVNTPGELYIGGLGVSKGYINNSELNHKCFIDAACISTPGQKLYKTGDLAKWTSEGVLYYIGRMDTQIKLRGYRIEVEAIENVLLEYPGIRECIVHDQTPEKRTELVAYLILNAQAMTISKIREYLRIHLPDYMIPTKYIVVNEFPLTFNGKINRKVIPCIIEYTYLDDEIAPSLRTQNSNEKIIINCIQSLLNKEDIHPECNFSSLGLHSLLLVDLTNMLNKSLNKAISVVDLFTYPTVRSLAQFLIQSDSSSNEKQNTVSSEISYENCIAIIGMACKFPGGNNPKEFWENIVDKKETISFFNANDLVHAGVPSHLINNPDYVPARGILDDIDQFDAEFFGYSPSEARMMDPQHRIFLELAWEALEDSGYVAEKYPGSIGVFAGMSDSTYLTQNILQTNYDNYDQQQVMLATSSHYLCTKVAYALGLTGSAITVSSACSTSLVAIAAACDNLKNNQCDMALAGGITISVPQQSGYMYRDLGILSPTGHCRVFDQNSKGTVMSNGCGIVVLKRLSDALKDNDNILAVIKGWAINNDGKHKAGFTAPSVLGQISCIKEAIKKSEISPENIGYIEAHGTGTLLGDPIEISALAKGYGYDIHKKNNYCALGSVKANVGHTDVASGVAGLIKLTMAIKQKMLPPQIHFSVTNEKINLEHSPFYVNTEIKPWVSKSKCIGAVHSLGFGGTNAHMILEEAPVNETSEPTLGNVFILSAKTEYSLNAIKTKLQKHLDSFSEAPDRERILADMVFTLQTGRKHFQYRMAVNYLGYESLVTKLSGSTHKYVIKTDISRSNERIIFGFTGQGTQYINIASDLYQSQPIFKRIVDECCVEMQKYLQCDLRDILFPKSHYLEEAKEQLANTLYAQPTLFIIEYALAQVFIALGIKPDAMIGHSLGEYVAATLSGVFSIETSLKIIATRARLMAKTKSGGMLIVPLSLETLSPVLPESLDLAAHNAPKLCVVSGLKEDLLAFENTLKPLLEAEEAVCKYLPVSQAFHSAAMEEILDEFTNALREIEFNSPSIPYISNVSGTWIQASDLTPQYWANHLRNPVFFSEGVGHLEIRPEDIFIEIGSGSTLIQLLRQHPCAKANHQLISTLPHSTHNSNSYQCLIKTLGKLWLLNKEIHWERLYTNEIRKRTSLPTYAFDRQSYWIYPKQDTVTKDKGDIQGLYTPSWKKDINTVLNKSTADPCERKTWLIFSNNNNNDLIEKNIIEAGHIFYKIVSGDYFEQLSKNVFVIDPTQKKHYEQMLKSVGLKDNHCIILHSWLFDNKAINEDIEAILYNGAYSILFLTQLLFEMYPQIHINFLGVTSNLYSVLGNESILPAKASLLGPCKVLPLEQDNIFCKVVDLPQDLKLSTSLAQCIFKEALVMDQDCAKTEIAYRGNTRWVRILEPCSEYIKTNKNHRIKTKGVYLITGGLGGIGLALAQYLAEHYQANVILVSHNGIIPEYEWENYISQNEQENKKTIQKIKLLLNIKTKAASLTIEQASIENELQMQRVIYSILKRFGKLHGVIHAAGIAGGGIAQIKTIEEYNRVLEPKLQGTQTLLKILHEQPMDFMVYISSITSILGFPGQSDYCSANRILDAYANTFPFKHSVFCIAMNWQAWRDIGMAAESQTKLFQLDATNSNTPAEGVVLFDKILNSDFNQVIVSNSDPNRVNISLEPKHSNFKEVAQSIEDKVDIDSITSVVLNIWRSVLGIDNIQLDDDFYELGGHSLLAIHLLAKLKNHFNIPIPASILITAKTVATLSKAIQSYTDQDQSPLVVLKEGVSDKLPLFIVHPIGGTVYCYLKLINALKNDRIYYGLQDLSLECEKPLFQGIEEMAAFYRKSIQKIQAKGPYYLCGASFGATVITEITHQLLELKEEVHFVGLIDGWALCSNAQLDANYVETLKLHHRDHPGAAIIPQSIENIDLWESMLKHRINMMNSYSFKKINTKLSLFKAREILLEYQEIDAVDNHWSRYSSIAINCNTVPGDHNSMLQEPNVLYLAKKIQKQLDLSSSKSNTLSDLHS